MYHIRLTCYGVYYVMFDEAGAWWLTRYPASAWCTSDKAVLCTRLAQVRKDAASEFYSCEVQAEAA